MTERTIKHHLTESLLMAYSSGNLPEALSLAVATHISICDHCRAVLESYDAVGGALLEDSTQVSVNTDALTRTLSMIRSGPQDIDLSPAVKIPVNATREIPAPLSDYIGDRFEEIVWKPIGMGVKQSIIDTSDDATASLLYIPPGTAVPDHSHN